MPLALVLGSLLFGIAFTLDLAGRAFAISWIDLVAYATAIAGLVQAVRVRRVRLDAALLGYLALFAVIAAQVAVFPYWKDIAGGSSRFVTAASVVFGLSQFVPQQAAAADEPPSRAVWRWPAVVGGFAAVLTVWVLVQLGLGLADPALRTFYEVKNNVVTPLGASNFLALFLLVPAAMLWGVAARWRRWIPVAAVATVGMIGTLSRGAFVAFVVTVLAGLFAAAAQRWRPMATAVLALGVLSVLLVDGGVLARGAPAVAATRTAPSPVHTATAADPPPPGALAATTTAPSPAATTAPTTAPSASPEPGASPSSDVLEGVLHSRTSGRLAMFRAAWHGFLDHPVIGVGLNSFLVISHTLQPPQVNAHNLELHALATMGALGAAAYLSLWLVLVWRCWRLPAGWQRRALALGALAMLLHAQVEALAFTRAYEALLAVLLVISGALPGAWGVRTVSWSAGESAESRTTPDGG